MTKSSSWCVSRIVRAPSWLDVTQSPVKFFWGGSVREMLARGFSRLRTRDRCHVQRRICKRGSCESSRVTGAVGSECDSLPRLIIHIGGCATWRGVQPRALLVPFALERGVSILPSLALEQCAPREDPSCYPRHCTGRPVRKVTQRLR